MKTIEQEAREYAGCSQVPEHCDSCHWIAEEYESCCNRLQYKAFLAGYETAFEWTSVNDELPDSSRAILASADLGMERIFCWVSNIHEGRIVSYSDDFFGVIEATHWREIEIPE